MFELLPLLACLFAGSLGYFFGRVFKIRESSWTSAQEIKDLLGRFDSKIDTVERERERGQSDLNRFISTLQNSAERLGQETGRLVSALKSTKGQGRWGEAQLRNVVESAGLHEFCDFEEQSTSMSGGRPDLIISLPGGRKLIIDAKVSLNAFLTSSETNDEKERSRRLQEHVYALKSHVKTLADRDYPASIKGAISVTMLFLPSESLYAAALEADINLPHYCYERKVLIITPISLIAFLTLVSSGWQEIKLNEGAREISALGKELYKRLHTFNDHLGKLGRSLHSAVKDFNSVAGSMETRVLGQARKLAELGAKSGNDELGSITQIDTLIRSSEASFAAEPLN